MDTISNFSDNYNYKFSKEEKLFLLSLARKSIEHWLKYSEKLFISDEEISPSLKNNKACFVTIIKNGKLRGCIGCLEPIAPLYQNVISNAVSAAFFDPRFSPLTKEELKEIKIELSILDKPKKFEYRTINELLIYLEREKPGIIIKKGKFSATFLPQVWNEIETVEEFLSHLCLKAGLPALEWQKGDLEVFIYNVQHFCEE